MKKPQIPTSLAHLPFMISRTALRKDDLGSVKTRTANERHESVACYRITSRDPCSEKGFEKMRF